MKVAALLLMVVSVLLVALAASEEDPGKIWAVLVAGSNGFMNYRHQADICHAYQIFHRHGIPDSQIIVMMYDDIADNIENKKKGKIFNKPQGPNVYVGVPKDYTKSQVTPENFIHVLTGNSTAVQGVGSGKVLKSGPNDHVFINFVDRGAGGLVSFPDGDLLYKDVLNDALVTMHKNGMFKKLVFYMEASMAGSMFSHSLPDNIGVFAATAANEVEDSNACYFDTLLGVFLGDEFSVAWMEDIDSEEHQANQTTETLLQQYKNVVKRVTDSHPQLYGEMDIENDHVMDFVGASDHTTIRQTGHQYEITPFEDSVSSRDVALSMLTRSLKLTTDITQRGKLLEKRDILLKGRKTVNNVFKEILTKGSFLAGVELRDLETSRRDLTLDMMPCYRTLVDNFAQSCIDIGKNSYVFGHLYKLANICALDSPPVEEILDIYNEACSEDVQGLTGVN